MKILRTSAVLALALAPAAFALPAHAAEKATVSILHGVPGATVDVYANGDPLLTDFKPGTLTDPVMLPAGDYDLKVTAAGAGAGVGCGFADGAGVGPAPRFFLRRLTSTKMIMMMIRMNPRKSRNPTIPPTNHIEIPDFSRPSAFAC